MSTELTLGAEETIACLAKMMEDGALGSIDFYKAMVSLAYESYIDQKIDDCLLYLNKIDPNFLMAVIPLDIMKEDPTFRNEVMFLAHKLIQNGLVDTKQLKNILPEADA